MGTRKGNQTKALMVAMSIAQMSHDIRSPLTALKILLEGMSTMPQTKRQVAIHALRRIEDIVNDLGQKNKVLLANTVEEAHTKVVDLGDVLRSLVLEKRLEYDSCPNIRIIDDYGHGKAQYPVRGDEGQLKRVFSNLLNNAIEACDGKGKVLISLKAYKTVVVLRIRDRGKGIPGEVLKRLGRRGFTYGKEHGSGLGVFHAKSIVESLGGRFFLKSAEGKGTIAIIEFPRELLK